MLRPITRTAIPVAPLKSCAAALGLLAALCGAAWSQSAPVFENSSSPLEQEATGPAPVAAEPEPAEIDMQPSRYAGAQLDAYLTARAAALSIKTRTTDPFGLHQDLEAQRVVEEKLDTDQPSRRQAAIPPTPLAEIIKLIRITTIMPREKSFLVGTRSFSEGDEFPIVYQGKSMRVKVMQVGSQKILFRNLDSREDAYLQMDLLPPGMIAGSDKIKPAGMDSPSDNLPLNLGGPTN